MSLAELKFDAQGLVTVVVQDRLSGEIRMLAHANLEALERTLQHGEAHFYSRSRGRLWRKGEESGNTITVGELWTDCDGDAVVYLADPSGPSCHTGRTSCFYRRIEQGGALVESPSAHARSTLPRLWAGLEARRNADGDASYTRSLLDKGASKIGDKLREEADELARALADESDERVVSEAADVIYHLLVGLLLRGATLKEVEAELSRRFAMSGLQEKASRGKGTP